MRGAYVTLVFVAIYIVFVTREFGFDCPRVCTVRDSDPSACIIDTDNGCAREYPNECVFRKDQCDRGENHTQVDYSICIEAKTWGNLCKPRASWVN